MTEKETKTDQNYDNQTIVEEKIVKVTGDIQIRKYSKGRLLGKGGFAKCYEFVCLDTKKVYAAKIVTKSSLVKSRAKQKLISEIKIHRSLHHQNIVTFEHYFEDTENVYILLEMCQNQSLNELLKRRKRLTEIEVQCYLIQLINALKYLHTHRVIHRDLKLGNLFLNDKMEVKTGDFGLACKLEFEGEKKRTVCGTPNYIAPEILDGKQGHSYEVDIWSLGVIAYTLLVGKPPFETQDVKATYKRIKMNAYSFPDVVQLSEAAKSFISEILLTDPAKRPTLDQLVAHDFFNQGTSIPKTLPSSTLACPPSISYIRQFMPDAGPNGIVAKPSTTTQRVADSSNMNLGSKIATDRNKQFSTNTQTDFNANQRPMTTTTNNQKSNLVSSRVTNTVTAGVKVENIKGPDVWVNKWVDYSSKYGLGYLLSNKSIGVFFNDASKIVLEPQSSNFNYIERRASDKQEIVFAYTLTSYPEDLRKKVTLLQHFKSYLEGSDEAKVEAELDKEDTTKNNLVYVKKWMRTRHAIMFRLSNKIVQVCFQDKTEIILSSESRVVTYVNKKSERSTYELSNALESTNYEMTKRLKYTKDILTHMLTLNSNQKGGVVSNKNEIELNE